MLATFADRPILDRAGLPKITKRTLALVDSTGRTVATHTFNPNSPFSRILARQRLAEQAQRVGMEVTATA